MAQYYNASDSDSDSFDEVDYDEEYSSIDYGVHSVVSFGPTSVYGTGRRRVVEEALYELVEASDGDNFYSKVQVVYKEPFKHINCSLVTLGSSEVKILAVVLYVTVSRVLPSGI